MQIWINPDWVFRFHLSLIEAMWLFRRKGPSGFSSSSTAEEVTDGIDGTGLTAIVTGPNLLKALLHFVVLCEL